MSTLETNSKNLEEIITNPFYQIPQDLKARLENLSANLKNNLAKLDLTLERAHNAWEALQDVREGKQGKAEILALAKLETEITSAKTLLNGGENEDF